MERFIQNVGLSISTFYFKIALFFRIMRNYYHRRITVSISLFSCEKFYFGMKHFIWPWDIFFCRETFYFAVRLFLSSWDFFFHRDIFLFTWDFFFLREIYFSLWDVFFWCETFSFPVRIFLLKILLSKAKMSGHHTRRNWKAMYLCIV